MVYVCCVDVFEGVEGGCLYTAGVDLFGTELVESFW